MFGQATGSLGTLVCGEEAALAAVPPGVGSAAAASLPTVFLTALACMDLVLAGGPGVRAGPLLVHAATGGLGVALLQLARLHDLPCAGTAGMPSKRAAGRAGGHAMLDSRSTGERRKMIIFWEGERGGGE